MEKEIQRLLDVLAQTNPISLDYKVILSNLEKLIRLKSFDESIETATPINEPVVKETEPTPVVEPVSEPVPLSDKSVVQPAREVETYPVIEKVIYDRETVRALLSDASKNGIQIQPIIAKYVPEGCAVKFSEIPVQAYADLVEEIKNAG